MIDWLKAIQLKPRFLFGAFLLTALLLFAPPELLNKLGLSIQGTSWQPYVGLVCLGCFILWLIQTIPSINAWRYQRNNQQLVIDRLSSLSLGEWTILWYCLDKNQQTVGLSATDKIATSLASKGILYVPAGQYSILAYPYSIPDFLWNYLIKNKERIFNKIPLEESEVRARVLGLEQHIHRHDY